MSYQNAQLLYTDARRLMEGGNLEEAVRLFERALQEFVHFKTLELMGECYQRLGQTAKAIVCFAAATTLNKGVRAPSLLAETLAQSGDVLLMSKAEDILTTISERDPKSKKASHVKKLLAENQEFQHFKKIAKPDAAPRE